MENRTVYGLIGRKLGHSDSKIIHEAFGLPGYSLFEMEPEELCGFLNTPNLKGLNVTIPYKREIMPYLDEISPEARAVGGVNTIVFTDDGRKIGHNTDVYGFMYMTQRAGIDVRGKKALIFGTGGASGAARCALERLGAREILFVSRTGEINYENLFQHEDAEILVNATPVGMYPNPDGCIADPARFKNAVGALDMVYNPSLTEFLRRAKAAGIAQANGLSMLVAQAKLAEEYFLSKSIPDSETERVLGEVARARTTIALVGMPGCGKSAVGERLGKMTGLTVMDADAEIEREEGMRICDIMREKGVSYFRDAEQRVIRRLSLVRGGILVTGGGAVLREENRVDLKRNARVYHLNRALSLLPTDGRPLSQGADLAEMEKQRAPFYEAVRDVKIENNASIEQAASAIWRDFCENTRN